MELVYYFIHPVKREGIRLRGRKGGITIEARCKFHFIREDEIQVIIYPLRHVVVTLPVVYLSFLFYTLKYNIRLL